MRIPPKHWTPERVAMYLRRNKARNRAIKTITCIHCKVTKPKKEFYRHTKKSGCVQIYRTCKVCATRRLVERRSAIRRDKNHPLHEILREKGRLSRKRYLERINADPVRRKKYLLWLRKKNYAAKARGYNWYMAQKAKRQAEADVKAQDPKIQELLKGIRSKLKNE